jgi:type VI protein secretion system component VasK
MAMTDLSARHHAALERLSAEQKQERDEKATVWAFIWTLFAFKIASVAVLLYWIGPGEFAYIVGATTWPWLVIPGIALSGPIGYRLRLRRMRKRREALRRAEFSTGRTQRRIPTRQ